MAAFNALACQAEGVFASSSGANRNNHALTTSSTQQMSRADTSQSINVDFDTIQLAADLVLSKSQNLDYWRTVPVPLDPNREMPGEPALRAAVFAPLALVAAALVFLNVKAAMWTFLAAFPVMVLLHRAITGMVSRHLHAAAQLDAGRFAAVDYLAKKTGLAPKDITWAFINELFLIYAKAWMKINDEHKATQAAKRKAEAEAAAERGRRRPARTSSGYVVASAAAVAAGGVAYTAADSVDAPQGMKFNPANGLPMMDDVFDIHGNTTGTTDVDDLAYLDDMHPGASQGFDDFAAPSFDTGSFGGALGYGFD